MREEEYGKLNRVEMSIWESIELLNEFVDESDPDLDEPQIEHLLQTAEAIRKDYPNEDWLHLTGLIHGTICLWIQTQKLCRVGEWTTIRRYLDGKLREEILEIELSKFTNAQFS